jgi:hypothetical protein
MPVFGHATAQGLYRAHSLALDRLGAEGWGTPGDHQDLLMMAVGGNRPLPELLLGVSQRPYGVLKYCWGLFYASRWQGSRDKANLAMGGDRRWRSVMACSDGKALWGQTPTQASHPAVRPWLAARPRRESDPKGGRQHRWAATPPFAGQSPAPTSSCRPWWQGHAPSATLGGYAAIRRAEPSSHQ